MPWDMSRTSQIERRRLSSLKTEAGEKTLEFKTWLIKDSQKSAWKLPIKKHSDLSAVPFALAGCVSVFDLVRGSVVIAFDRDEAS